MNSPITGKPMKLVKEPGSTLTFRKEEFEITYHYYLCEKSGEQFTNDELDAINQIQVHNLYREKYGVPFTEEIKNIRSKYNVSASKLSEILGMGTNTYRLYEDGEIPSVTNGRLILAIKHPKDFMKQVQASAHLLSEREIRKFTDTANALLEENKRNHWNILFTKHIFNQERPNEYTGFSCPDLSKIAQVINYFSHEKEVFKTKLNKLLFYADFGHYQQCGFSITGISYRAIKFGPVPSEYDKMYMKLCDDKLIALKQVEVANGDYGDAISGTQKFNSSLFSDLEKNILEQVGKKFLNLNTKKVVDKSHQEQAWISNEGNKNLISYQQFAFDLKNL
ncbi:MAG: type II toxin-antitoxin system antitoxin SocA domain-containing protein [Bacteroidota bacterium]